jgi:hypothetical protein
LKGALSTTHDTNRKSILATHHERHVLTAQLLILILSCSSGNASAVARVGDHITIVQVILVTAGKHDRFGTFPFPAANPGLPRPMDTCFGKCRAILEPCAFCDSRDLPKGALGHRSYLTSAPDEM